MKNDTTGGAGPRSATLQELRRGAGESGEALRTHGGDGDFMVIWWWFDGI